MISPKYKKTSILESAIVYIKLYMSFSLIINLYQFILRIDS